MQREFGRRLQFMAGSLAGILLWLAPWAPAFSQNADIKSVPERVVVSSGLDSEALASTYPDQAVWLETERFGRALALFESERTATPRGAVLVLADEGQTANTGLAGAIRAPFAEAGWAAMTLGLPALPLALEQVRLARREQPHEADTEPDSIMIDVMDSDELEQLGEEYRARLQAHLAAAVDNLTTRGYSRLVLVSVGRGAEHMMQQITNGSSGQTTLVMIAPKFEPARNQLVLDNLKAVANLSLLDMVSSRYDLMPAKARRSSMKREGVTGYQQQSVAMGQQPLARNARGLANRIIAWLKLRE